MKMPQSLIFILFFLSGTSSLIFEILWGRWLAVFFGVTTFALTTVIASFMAGLALGSFYGGKKAEAVSMDKNPASLLRVYAMLEGGIGAYSLFTPLLFKGLQTVFYSFYAAAHPSFFILTLWKFSAAFFILLPATVLMGATLPVLIQYSSHSSRNTGYSAGTLYALNTMGAVTGTLMSAFYLIPHFGLLNALFFATGMNFLICILVLTAGAQNTKRRKREKISSDKTIGILPLTADNKLLLTSMFLAGMTALSMELAWTRALCLFLGTTVYSFSVILAVFLFGMSSGSFLCARKADSIKNLSTTFGACLFLAGFLSLLSMSVFQKIPFVFPALYQKSSQTFSSLYFVVFFLTALLLIPSTFFMGALFPLCMKMHFKTSTSPARASGEIYAANTLGAITGTLLTGFYLIYALGIQNTLLAACAVNAILGLSFILREPLLPLRTRAVRAGAPAFLFFLVFLLTPSWTKELMSTRVFLRLPSLAAEKLKEDRQFMRVLFYKEGWNATVSVVQRTDNLSLMINGKVDASNTRIDLHTQFLTAAIPVTLHPKPEKILLVGLGSGITASSATILQPEKLDVVEIEPAVKEASQFFKYYNHDVLSQKNVSTFLEDARTFVFTRDEAYDVIISEPSNLWVSGMANLFTTEYYKNIHKLLNKDGVLCQWVQTYKITEDDFKIVLRTLMDVFPRTTLWFSAPGDMMLISQKGNAAFDFHAMEEKIKKSAEYKAALQATGFIHPYFLIKSSFLLGVKPLRVLAGTGVKNTDNHPVLEFSVPRHIFEPEHQRTIWKTIQNLRGQYPSFPVANFPEALYAPDKDNFLLAKIFFQRNSYKAARMLFKEIPENSHYFNEARKYIRYLNSK